jgi:death-on-curing protein
VRPRWVRKDAVLAIHQWLLAEHGGLPGITSEGALDGALASPQNHLAYGTTDLFDLAAQYAFALTRDHPFKDGNKRVAFVVAAVFLEMNGFRLEAPEVEAVAAVNALSTGSLDAKTFAAWLRDDSVRIPVTKRSAGRQTRRPRRKAK